jgi:uncharacterized protein
VNLADVNVLVGAAQTSARHHLHCKKWLENELDSGRPFAVAPLAMAAMARVTTNPKAFNPPLSLNDAMRFAGFVLGNSNCRIVEAGPSHWTIFESLCRAADATHNLITDAWYAALAIEHDCTFVTLDRGFARFPGLKKSSPLIAS